MTNQSNTSRGRLTEAAWHDYAAVKPDAVGPYEWQIPSRACKDMTVRVLANFRKRGAGHTDVVSPEFDYWDGYNVHVPAGTRWRAAPEGTEIKQYSVELLCVEGLDPVPCPFCHTAPRIKGIEKSGNSVVITSNAHTFNTWWFECCAWAKTPHYADPRDIEKARRAALQEQTP